MRSAFLAAAAFSAVPAFADQPTAEQQQVQATIAQTIGTLTLQNAQLSASVRSLQDAVSATRADLAAAQTNLAKERADAATLRAEVHKLKLSPKRAGD